MKKLISCIVAVFALVCVAIGLTGCLPTSVHRHDYTRTVVKSNCSEKGFTINECACGNTYMSDETPFDPNVHNYDESGFCTLCGHEKGTTVGIEYGLSEDRTYAEVIGYKGTETSIIIASTYNDLPVKGLRHGAFKESNIKQVIIPDSVTNIGRLAFNGCTSLTSVTIGNGVTSIGECAFDGCESLKSITIPDSVTDIGNWAFDGCESLKSITIGNGVKSIGWDAFCNTAYYNDNNNWKNQVLYIGNHLIKARETFSGDYQIKAGTLTIAVAAFYGCSGLTSIIIPDSITSIGSSSFFWCKGLTSVTLGNGVTNIGYGTFSDCTGLTSITIPEAVTSIGISAFQNCESLKSITIPETVTSIGEYAFNNTAYNNDNSNWENDLLYIGKHLIRAKTTLLGDYQIKDGTLSIANRAFYQCSELTSITMPETVTNIGDSAFYDCTGLTSITMPETVTNIGNSAFYGCESLTTVYYTGTIDQWAQIHFNYYESNPLFYAENLYINNQLLTEANITTATKINAYAFRFYKKLTDVTIGNGVTSIGESAFDYCTGLASVIIDNGVTSIGNNAFRGCESLTSITIPGSVTDIGEDAFHECYRLTSITIPEEVTHIGSYAFFGCDSLTSVYYTGTIDQWVQINFYDYKSNPLCHAKNLYVNNQLLTEAKITTATQIKNFAFYGYGRLTSVIIPKLVTNIGDSAFEDCYRLKSLTIPDSVKSIGISAFEGCQGLTMVTIPDSVKDIANNAFWDCNGLTSITIGSTVKSIGSRAFESCNRLTSIIIPNAVKSIGERAFYDCASLKKVYFKGTEAEWNAINIDNLYGNNDKLTTATRYYYSEKKPTKGGNYWHYDADGKVVEW